MKLLKIIVLLTCLLIPEAVKATDTFATATTLKVKASAGNMETVAALKAYTQDLTSGAIDSSMCLVTVNDGVEANNLCVDKDGNVNITGGLETSTTLKAGTDLTVLGNTTLGDAKTDAVTSYATVGINASSGDTYTPAIFLKCDDNAATTTITDSSGNGRSGHMHVANTSTYTTTGKLGSAFTGIGDTEHADGFGTWFPSGQSLAVCAWLSWTGGASETVFFAGNGTMETCALYGGSGIMYFGVRATGGLLQVTKTMPTDGLWHFVCGWYDGANLHLKIDNEAATPVAQTGDISTSNVLRIFNYNPTGYAWAGGIDGVRFFENFGTDGSALASAVWNFGKGTDDVSVRVNGTGTDALSVIGDMTFGTSVYSDYETHNAYETHNGLVTFNDDITMASGKKLCLNPTCTVYLQKYGGTDYVYINQVMTPVLYVTDNAYFDGNARMGDSVAADSFTVSATTTHYGNTYFCDGVCGPFSYAPKNGFEGTSEFAGLAAFTGGVYLVSGVTVSSQMLFGDDVYLVMGTDSDFRIHYDNADARTEFDFPTAQPLYISGIVRHANDVKLDSGKKLCLDAACLMYLNQYDVYTYFNSPIMGASALQIVGNTQLDGDMWFGNSVADDALIISATTTHYGPATFYTGNTYTPAIFVRAEDNAATDVVINAGTAGNGVLSSGPTATIHTASGKINGAFTGLGAAQYVSNFGGFKFSGGRVFFSYWYKAASDPGIVVPVSQTYGSVSMYTIAGLMAFRIESSSGSSASVVTANYDGQWHHVACSYDRAALGAWRNRMWHDGVEGTGESAYDEDINVSSDTFGIGDVDGVGTSFPGGIDLLWGSDDVHDSEAAAVVAALWNGGVGTDSTNITAGEPTFRVRGTSATSYLGISNDGTDSTISTGDGDLIIEPDALVTINGALSVTNIATDSLVPGRIYLPGLSSSTVHIAGKLGGGAFSGMPFNNFWTTWANYGPTDRYFLLAMWIKTPGAAIDGLFLREGISTQYMLTTEDDGKLYAQGPSGASYRASGDITWDNAWHFVCWSVDTVAGTNRLWFDATELTAGSESVMGSSPGEYCFGYGGSPFATWSGGWDDIRVYHNVTNSSAPGLCSALRNGGSGTTEVTVDVAGVTHHPVVYMPLDDNADTNLIVDRAEILNVGVDADGKLVPGRLPSGNVHLDWNSGSILWGDWPAWWGTGITASDQNGGWGELYLYSNLLWLGGYDRVQLAANWDTKLEVTTSGTTLHDDTIIGDAVASDLLTISATTMHYGPVTVKDLAGSGYHAICADSTGLLTDSVSCPSGGGMEDPYTPPDGTWDLLGAIDVESSAHIHQPIYLDRTYPNGGAIYWGTEAPWQPDSAGIEFYEGVGEVNELGIFAYRFTVSSKESTAIWSWLGKLAEFDDTDILFNVPFVISNTTRHLNDVFLDSGKHFYVNGPTNTQYYYWDAVNVAHRFSNTIQTDATFYAPYGGINVGGNSQLGNSTDDTFVYAGAKLMLGAGGDSDFCIDVDTNDKDSTNGLCWDHDDATGRWVFDNNVYFSGSVTATTFSGNSSTASALAANGSNCGAGTGAGGVSAAGVAEDCYAFVYDTWTAPDGVLNITGGLETSTTMKATTDLTVLGNTTLGNATTDETSISGNVGMAYNYGIYWPSIAAVTAAVYGISSGGGTVVFYAGGYSTNLTNNAGTVMWDKLYTSGALSAAGNSYFYGSTQVGDNGSDTLTVYPATIAWGAGGDSDFCIDVNTNDKDSTNGLCWDHDAATGQWVFDNPVQVLSINAATNTVVNTLTIGARSATTAADGFGAGVDWYLDNDAGAYHSAAKIDVVWHDNAEDSEDARFDFKAMLAGTLTSIGSLSAMSATTGGGLDLLTLVRVTDGAYTFTYTDSAGEVGIEKFLEVAGSAQAAYLRLIGTAGAVYPPYGGSGSPVLEVCSGGACPSWLTGTDLGVEGDLEVQGTFLGNNAGDIGWSHVHAAAATCTDSCTHTCVIGITTATAEFANCNTSITGTCLCAGDN